MKALLVRIGIDQAFGGWNAPVDAGGRFVYVPIPEKTGTRFHPGLQRGYGEVLPALSRFCGERGFDLITDLGFPQSLLKHAMHLDPDFECLTYGDRGSRRGAGMVGLKKEDLLLFYGGLRPVHVCEHNLIYALMGLFVVQEVLNARDLPRDRWFENAHVRKSHCGDFDIVVRGIPGISGRLERGIPVGEWRSGAYRLRRDVLRAWGGLSVKDGFIQRSAVPPRLADPGRFLRWWQSQNVPLLERNN